MVNYEPRRPPAIVDALDGADDATLQAVIEYCEAELEAEDEQDEPTKADSDPPEEFEGDAEQWADAIARKLESIDELRRADQEDATAIHGVSESTVDGVLERVRE